MMIKTQNMLLIIVTADDTLRDYCLKQVEQADIDCRAVSTLGELFTELGTNYCSGVLIDIASSIKAKANEKTKAHEVLPLFPVLRLKWNKEKLGLNCLLQNNVTNTNTSIPNFIDHHCRPFKPRRIRTQKRFPLHFSVLISRDEKFQRLDVERSTTLDISLGGCSLLTTQHWEEETCIWMKFIEMADQTPIQGTICRWTQWGEPMEIPSIGVCFDSLSESQQQQLSKPSSINQTASKIC